MEINGNRFEDYFIHHVFGWKVFILIVVVLYSLWSLWFCCFFELICSYVPFIYSFLVFLLVTMVLCFFLLFCSCIIFGHCDFGVFSSYSGFSVCLDHCGFVLSWSWLLWFFFVRFATFLVAFFCSFVWIFFILLVLDAFSH